MSNEMRSDGALEEVTSADFSYHSPQGLVGF